MLLVWIPRSSQERHASYAARVGNILLWGTFKQWRQGGFPILRRGWMRPCILRFWSITSLRALMIDHGWLFHHDNDMKPTTRATMVAPFQFPGVTKPVFSPNLNGKVFGGIWNAVLSQQNLKDLEKICMEECAKIPAAVCANLIKNYRKHIYKTIRFLQNYKMC